MYHVGQKCCTAHVSAQTQACTEKILSITVYIPHARIAIYPKLVGYTK